MSADHTRHSTSLADGDLVPQQLVEACTSDALGDEPHDGVADTRVVKRRTGLAQQGERRNEANPSERRELEAGITGNMLRIGPSCARRGYSTSEMKCARLRPMSFVSINPLVMLSSSRTVIRLP